MKKVFLLIIGFMFISTASWANNVPEGVKSILLSKTWQGFYTNDSYSGANGYHRIALSFTEDEAAAVEGMVTIFNVKVGNKFFNPSEFLKISYKDKKEDTGILYLSYLDPTTRLDRATYTFKATRYSRTEISGPVYLTDPTAGKTWKIGIFKVQ